MVKICLCKYLKVNLIPSSPFPPLPPLPPLAPLPPRSLLSPPRSLPSPQETCLSS